MKPGKYAALRQSYNAKRKMQRAADAKRSKELQKLQKQAKKLEKALQARTQNPESLSAAARADTSPEQDLEKDQDELMTGDDGENPQSGAEGADQETLASKLKLAEEQNAELQLEIAKLRSGTETLLGRGIPGSKQTTSSPAVDLTKVVNKPGLFDGVTAGRFHEWRNEVQMYLRVMKFPPQQEAGIVQSYLKGTALAWYIQKLEKLEANGQPVPTSWEQLLPLLNERFEHRNPELAARDKLMNLRQGSLTLHQYLKEFEGCYAYIPRWEEADKIHRFLFGLKNHLRAKFCVDPATHSWWTSFDGLVSYITSYMSDDMTSPSDLVEEVARQGRENISVREKPSTPAKPKPNFTRKQFGLSKGHMQKLLHMLNKGGVRKNSAKTPGGRKSYLNSNSETVTRDARVVRFCHQQSPQLCMGCYRPGHQVAQCTASVAKGVPEGYNSR